MGLGEAIRDLVADVGVNTNDINTGAVTQAKLNNSAGKWFTGTFAAGGDTVAFTVLVSSTITVLDAIVVVSTEHSAAATFTVQNTAKSSILISAIPCSTARTIRIGGTETAAITAVRGVALELVSGQSIEGTLSALSDEVAGNYFLYYITTPS